MNMNMNGYENEMINELPQLLRAGSMRPMISETIKNPAYG
jgi:hypothetical protein